MFYSELFLLTEFCTHLGDICGLRNHSVVLISVRVIVLNSKLHPAHCLCPLPQSLCLKQLQGTHFQPKSKSALGTNSPQQTAKVISCFKNIFSVALLTGMRQSGTFKVKRITGHQGERTLIVGCCKSLSLRAQVNLC